MRWAEPYWLILLALVPVPWLLGRRRSALPWPTLRGFAGAGSGLTRFKAGLPHALRGLMVAALAVGLARPQTVGGRTRIAGQGVAIIVALDQSSSMHTADFPTERGPVTRLEAARETLARFVSGRPDDLIGLVVFANYPDLACPPTLSHAFLLDVVASVRQARPGEDGTNLGDALIWGLEALRDTTPARKVLVLLTDGRNSPAVPSPADPVRAASLARALGVSVHTIAVGKGGPTRAVEPVSGLGVTVDADGPDLELLRRVAEEGGGRPFVASSAAALGEVFEAINALERSPVRGEVRTHYREHFALAATLALALLFLDRGLAVGWLRRLP